MAENGPMQRGADGANRYLLVSRTGPKSLHHQWLGQRNIRNFDIFLSSYDPASSGPEEPGLFHEYRPGAKVAGYGAFLRDHHDLLSRYDYVALFDDDLLIDAASLSRLFALAQHHDLKIAQPALTHGSYFTYAALLRHAGFVLRHVNYIEMMCPIFRTDILHRVAPLFDMGYESGIDLIWCNLVQEGRRDFAVIDAEPVVHTRRVGSAAQANGFGQGRWYEDDIAAILSRFDVPWLPCTPYGALRADGRYFEGRRGVARAALGLLPAIGRAAPLKRRARNLVTYWKHLLNAPARNVRLKWPDGTVER